jgi:hypothetical protein
MLKPPEPEAIAVIRSCSLSPESLSLPKRQLSKALYAEVKRVLNVLGGEWSTSAQEFVFGYDYQDRLHACLDGTQKLPERNPTAFFPTPADLATKLIAKSVGIRSLPKGARVIEPSAGRAALIDACLGVRPDLVFEACELDPFHRDHLSKKGVRLVGEDFLALNAPELYAAVVMNPPFSLPEDKFAWVTHMDKALDVLEAGVVLVAILPDAAMWRDSKPIAAVRERAKALGGVFLGNDKGAFKETGTMTATCTLFIGGVDTPESKAAAQEAAALTEATAERAAQTARIAAIVPDCLHAVAVGETEAACQRHFIVPAAAQFSDLFASWGDWTTRNGKEPADLQYICGMRGPYEASLGGIVRPAVMGAIKDSMLSGYTGHFELVSFEDGYTRVFFNYDQILGGRMVALVETRSIAFSASPSALPMKQAA